MKLKMRCAACVLLLALTAVFAACGNNNNSNNSKNSSPNSSRNSSQESSKINSSRETSRTDQQNSAADSEHSDSEHSDSETGNSVPGETSGGVGAPGDPAGTPDPGIGGGMGATGGENAAEGLTSIAKADIMKTIS